MNILYYHYTSSKDGQYVHISSIVDALRAIGHNVRLVGPAISGNVSFGRSGTLIQALKRFMPKFLYEVTEITNGLMDFFRVYFVTMCYRPDAIYYRYNLYSPAAVLVGRLLHIPVLMEVNAPLAAERSEFGGLKTLPVAKWFETLQWRSVDHIFAVSAVLRNLIQERGVSADCLTVLPNGINLDRFQPVIDSQQAKVLLGIEAFRVIGFVGFMREWHGLEQLLNWIKNLAPPDVMLLFVGDGPARPALEQRARELGVDSMIMITGVVEMEDVPRYLAAFDVAVLPRAVPYASPLKVFDYMAAGLPIIAPNQENIREILVNNKNAILFNEDCIFHSLEMVLSDDDLRLTIGSNARSDIERMNLTWDNNAKVIGDTIVKIKSCPSLN